MKIGLILECGPMGADKQVCEYLIKKLNNKIIIYITTLNNKVNLINNCGKEAKTLLDEGCEKIIIVWDLYPSWKTEKPKKPNLAEDRNKISDSLKKFNLDINLNINIFLVCIIQELEAWLISDEIALQQFLSNINSHCGRISKVKDPEKINNPKKVLNKIFKENIGLDYSDLLNAIQIIKLIDTNKLEKRCKSYKDFKNNIINKKNN
ncbi:MAG: DUF4276 family protein [Candidatus Sericytochromatia bacterium]